jgi:hypothetical protein
MNGEKFVVIRNTDKMQVILKKPHTMVIAVRIVNIFKRLSIILKIIAACRGMVAVN